MEFPKVEPANRPGGWEVEGVGYRRQAHLCLLAFEQKHALLQKHLERLEEARKKGGTYRIPPNLLERYRFFRSAAGVGENRRIRSTSTSAATAPARRATTIQPTPTLRVGTWE